MARTMVADESGADDEVTNVVQEMVNEILEAA